jgi:hypothetical protein
MTRSDTNAEIMEGRARGEADPAAWFSGREIQISRG